MPAIHAGPAAGLEFRERLELLGLGFRGPVAAKRRLDRRTPLLQTSPTIADKTEEETQAGELFNEEVAFGGNHVSDSGGRARTRN